MQCATAFLVAITATAFFVSCAPVSPATRPTAAAQPESPPPPEQPVVIAAPIPPPAPPAQPSPAPAELAPDEPKPPQVTGDPQCEGADIDIEELRHARACSVPYPETRDFPSGGVLTLEVPSTVDASTGGATVIPLGVRNASARPVVIDFMFGEGFPSASTTRLRRGGVAVPPGDCAYGALTSSQMVRVHLAPGGIAHLEALFWANDIQMEPSTCQPANLAAGRYVVGVELQDRSHNARLMGDVNVVVR